MATAKTYVRLQWRDPHTGSTKRFNEFAPITIGRLDDNTVALNSTEVSRHHAYITATDDKVVLVDRGSVNGILINGKRVKQQVVASGDTFQIGPYTFQIEYETVKMRAGVRYVQCSNPNCRRIVPLTEYDCPWCGYNLGNSDTVPAVS